MRFYIVIPAHNEADYIGKTLQSLISQSLLPSKVVVVNDNSSDQTQSIVEGYSMNHPFISLVNVTSSDMHLPGGKIIKAFYKGLNTLDEEYDVICKFDADLIFPKNYLEQVKNHFINDSKLGMVAGFCSVENNGKWVIENLTRKDHIRGALKAYRKKCFSDIGQLKSSMGWDTIDELLAKYYNWEILTDDTLLVKHLKPTGAHYNKASKYLQGEAMYKMRYGYWITLISALKLALKKKRIQLFFDYMSGFHRAKRNKVSFLVNEAQGKFIRRLRWNGIKKQLF